MGRTHADLVPFFRKGLEKNFYSNLSWVDKKNEWARLKLPRKCDKLSESDQKILKDWDTIRKRNYINNASYSEARQRFLQAIKKSIFIEEKKYQNTIDFRFRTPAEISEIRRKWKISRAESKANFSKALHSPGESSSSGYFSGPDLDEMDVDAECDQASKMSSVLESIHHDHNFGYNSWPQKVEEKLPDQIFEDSETEESVSDLISYEENKMISEDFGPGAVDENNFGEENFNRNEQSEDENHVDNLRPLKNEMYEKYVLVPLSAVAGLAQSFQETEGSSSTDFSDLILNPLNGSATLEMQMDDPSVPKIEEMMRAQEPHEGLWVKRSFLVWDCVQVIKADIVIQLVFEEKVYEVNSPLSGEHNCVDCGNLKVIVSPKVKEVLEDYYPFQKEMIGENLTIYCKPRR